MGRKSVRNTRGRIISTAWKLFYEQGYENTTVEDIVFESETSKGSFYHYFESKDALLGSLSYLFDEKYEELSETMDPSLGPVEKLITMNRELFLMIENTVSVSILSQLFSSNLTSKGERHLLDPDRTYYKLLRSIAIQGKQDGVFRDDLSVNDITKAYALYERGIMYDWCICNGDYSLKAYAARMMPQLLQTLRRKEEGA